MREIIRERLERAFKPFKLELEDQTHLHKGHLENPTLLETHFRLLIVADCFTNITQLQRHRMVHKVLSSELKEQVHALSMNIYTLNEYNNLKDT